MQRWVTATADASRALCITWRAHQRCQRQWRAFTRSIRTVGGRRLGKFLRTSGEIFAHVQSCENAAKNFCARPRKIVRTPPNKFAYANFAYVQQNFVRKRTEPKFCVRPENFAYVHERTKNLFVRPRKILRTSRKILRTSKKFLRTSKMLRFLGSARPEQISGLRSGSLLLLIRWHSAHGLGLLLGLARLSRLYICYW